MNSVDLALVAHCIQPGLPQALDSLARGRMRSLLALGVGSGLWALSPHLALPHVCSLPAPTVPDGHPQNPLLVALGGGGLATPVETHFTDGTWLRELLGPA